MASSQIGILGAGQLARMILDAAKKLDVVVEVLAKSKDESALFNHGNFQIGNVRNQKNLSDFLINKKIVIFENEFVDTELLRLSAKSSQNLFSPSLKSIEIAQDKLVQKKLYSSLGIPTSRFEILRNQEQNLFSNETKIFLTGFLRERLLSLWSGWPNGVVLKWSRMGYDGKGTLLLSKEWLSELNEKQNTNEQSLNRVMNFVSRGEEKGAQIYAEELIPFELEVAMVGARDLEGNFHHYPLVQSFQENGVCKKVSSLNSSLNKLSSSNSDTSQNLALSQSAARILKTVGEGVGLIGAYALEFFVTCDKNGNQELLVNELAPRVHNSGHFTQLASSIDQFELHLRAVLGLSIPKIETTTYFGMLNLLGPRSCDFKRPNLSFVELSALLEEFSLSNDFSVYWYDKSLSAGRKLGHINMLAESKDIFEKNWKLLEQVEAWWDHLEEI